MTLPFPQLSFPQLYEQELVPSLFRPWAELLLTEVRATRGERVLDVACGTGIVARLAKQQVGGAGIVVGVDLSPQMLVVARAVAPDVEWREGDAGALPLREGEQFDAVVCQQGFQFFPNQVEAAREMRRALATGGRFAASTWRSDEESPVLWELRRIAEQHVGPILDRRHGLGEPAPLEGWLADVGFSNIRSTRQTRTMRFTDGMLFVRLNAMALVGMSAGAGALDEGERGRLVEAIVQASAALVRQHTGQAGFAYEISANVTTANG